MRKIVLSIVGLSAIAVLLSYRIVDRLFDRRVREEVRAIIVAAEVRTGEVSIKDFEALPELVCRYFRYVGVEGKRFIWFAG